MEHVHRWAFESLKSLDLMNHEIAMLVAITPKLMPASSAWAQGLGIRLRGYCNCHRNHELAHALEQYISWAPVVADGYRMKTKAAEGENFG